MKNLLGESRDLKDERDSEAYQAMLEQVEREMWQAWTACGSTRGAEPTGIAIYEESMRRLRRNKE